MYIYLIRHAEGENSKRYWQKPSTKLSDFGRKQAKALAQLPRLEEADVILSSDWDRAKETAEIAISHLKLPIKTLSLIHEREQPTKIYGAERTSSFSIKYTTEMIENSDDLDWNFKNSEESIRDVAKRSIQFQKLLINKYKEQQILVFTHDVFIKCFVTTAILGERYDDKTFNRLFRSLEMSSAGISMLIFNYERAFWKVWYLNDLSYLKFMEY